MRHSLHSPQHLAHKNRKLQTGGGHSGIFFSVRTSEIPHVKSYIDNNLDGTYTPKWRKEDALGAFIGDIKANSEITTLYNTKEDGPIATFEGTLDATKSGVFKSMAPKQSFEECFDPIDGIEVIGIALGNAQDEYVQHPTTETIDEDCDILVSKPVNYTSDGETVVMDDVYFKRIMSIVKINVKGPESLDKEKVHNFTMTSSDAVLCGSAKVDITNAKVLGWTEERKSLTAAYSTEDDMPIVNDEVLNTVYLVANHTTLASGTELTFSGETDSYTFTKAITLPKDIVFPESQMAVINLTLNEENLTKSKTSYSIEFNSTAKSTTSINQSTKASTCVTAGAEYLTSSPFTESSNAYYGGNSNGLPLRIGKSDEPGSVTISLSELGQVGATTIVLSAKQYNSGKTFSIGVNNETKQMPGNDYTDLTFDLNGDKLSSIKLASDGYIYIKSITVITGSPKTALDTPDGLKVNGKIVSWDVVSGAASYNVTIGSETYTTTSDSYDASSIEDEYYDVAVVAVPSDKDNYKNSAAATLTAAKFGTPTLTAPELKEGAIDETSITVTWAVDSRATEGYYCGIYNGETKVAEKLATEGSVTFNDLADGQAYTIKVNAKAVSGEKAYEASKASMIELQTKPTYHVKDITAEDTYTIKNLKVYALVTNNNAIVGDGTGYLVFYKSKHGLTLGDTFDAAGEVVKYNGILEYNDATISNKKSGNAPEYTDAVEATEAYLTEYVASSSVQYVHAKGIQNGRYISVGSQKLYLSKENADTDGKNIDAYGFVYGYNSNKKNTSFCATSIKEDPAAPSLSVDKSSKTWASTETDVFVVKVSVNSEGGDWTVTPTSLDWATITVDKAAGTITVTPKGENTSDKANEATLTVTHTADASLTKAITLTQKAAGAIEKNITIDFSTFGFSNSKITMPYSKDIEPITVSMTKGTSNPPAWYSPYIRFYTGSTLTLTSDKIITKMVITAKSSDEKQPTVTVNSGTYTYNATTTAKETEWAGASKAITFTIGGSKNYQISKIVVTYND